MADWPVPPGMERSLLLALALLLAGAMCGYGEYFLRRLPWVPADRARGTAMAGALALTTVACATVVAASVRYLVVCTEEPGTLRCRRTSELAAFPAPVDGLPGLDLTVRIDGLATLFLLVIGFCAAGIAIYSFGWLRGDPLRHTVAGSFNLFVAATMLAVAVNNVFWLFVALELITLSSTDLVRYRGRSGGSAHTSRTAIRTYLVVSHVGLMCLFAGMLPVVVQHSSLDLDVLRLANSSPVPATSFLLVLLGLSVRAGIMPFHFWVPIVHPQLPTNTHAMMSAVMLKVPVYLMIRFFFEGVIGPSRWWWGAVLLVLAGGTALVTVFYALISKDLKTALAYHSVENIGIILAGVGLALLFSDEHLSVAPALRGAAALALLASLYHVVNHALFKTLLFLGTGSIERQTGTVAIGALGGLLRRMPWTGVAFLLGAVAIAGLPPLNGFISEWLTFQSLFGGRAVYQTPAPIALVALGALGIALITLAMAVAMTALAFLKIVGESLLGESRGVEPTGDGAWPMRAVMAVLAGLCLLLGLQPWLLVPWLSTAAAVVQPAQPGAPVLDATPAALTVQLSAATEPSAPYQAVLPMLPLLLLGVLPVLLTAALRATGWVRRPVWVGGKPFEPGTMQYPSDAVSALLWKPLARERRQTPAGPLPAEVRLSGRHSVAELTNQLANGLVAGVSRAAQRTGERLQSGDIRSYLLYIFAAVVLVLAVLTVSR